MRKKYLDILRMVLWSLIGIALVIGAIKIFINISQREKGDRNDVKKERPMVFVEEVKNEMKPITIKANGSLIAKDKIELFVEVQGVFERSAHIFKPGVNYRKGEVLLQLNSQEHQNSLKVQKSSLYQKLISVLPDLKLDYPNQFEKWNNYVEAFDINKKISDLPSFETSQEKLFISGKGIQTAFFSVKNLEERLSKYKIHAPFSGVLTKAMVTKGTLIRPGMQIGTFINPKIYELEVPINSSYIDMVKVGEKVLLTDLNREKSWSGTVARINKLIDKRTQSSTVFINVSGDGLREGMYLDANISGSESSLVFEVNRSLLNDKNQLFVIVQDSVLQSIKVDPVYFKEKTVMVKGLKDGDLFINRPVNGAFDGKIVKVSHQ